MTLAKFAVRGSAALALALALASCGGGPPPPSFVCPPPLTVQDAGRITHFRDGAGRDPRDIAYEAVLVKARHGVSNPLTDAERKGLEAQGFAGAL